MEKLFYEEPRSLEFQSQMRQTTARNIRKPYDFVCNFLKEQDVYVPAFMERDDRNLAVGQTWTLHFVNLTQTELERMDYLAQAQQ